MPGSHRQKYLPRQPPTIERIRDAAILRFVATTIATFLITAGLLTTILAERSA